MPPTRARGAASPASSSAESDPAAHLLREHSLLDILAARMDEIAAAVATGEPVPHETVERGLNLHRDLLIATHQAKDDWLAAALRPNASRDVTRVLEACARQHPLAEAFQTSCRAVVKKWAATPGRFRKSLADAWAAEAERIRSHDRLEAEELYHGPVSRLSSAAIRDLMRRFDTLRSAAIASEANLSQWSSEQHPASD